jgi:hypothetical protein
VIFSDLVGSTALSARMDPEDLSEVISAYQKCVAGNVLLILDEAHHAAPASGQAYAVDSQFTKAVRALLSDSSTAFSCRPRRTMDIPTALLRSSRFWTRSGSRADFRLSRTTLSQSWCDDSRAICEGSASLDFPGASSSRP